MGQIGSTALATAGQQISQGPRTPPSHPSPLDPNMAGVMTRGKKRYSSSSIPCPKADRDRSTKSNPAYINPHVPQAASARGSRCSCPLSLDPASGPPGPGAAACHSTRRQGRGAGSAPAAGKRRRGASSMSEALLLHASAGRCCLLSLVEAGGLGSISIKGERVRECAWLCYGWAAISRSTFQTGRLSSVVSDPGGRAGGSRAVARARLRFLSYRGLEVWKALWEGPKHTAGARLNPINVWESFIDPQRLSWCACMPWTAGSLASAPLALRLWGGAVRTPTRWLLAGCSIARALPPAHACIDRSNRSDSGGCHNQTWRLTVVDVHHSISSPSLIHAP